MHDACSSIRPGGTVVEGTAGNTGIGLAHVCRSRGYKCVIFMPNTQVRFAIARVLASSLLTQSSTEPGKD